MADISMSETMHYVPILCTILMHNKICTKIQSSLTHDYDSIPHDGQF